MPDPRLLHFANRLKRATRLVNNQIDLTGLIRSTNEVESDVVFEGGATLGSAYIGSLTLLESAGVRFRRVAGNSAGAITGALVAAGYKANEIEWLMSNFANPRVAKPNSLRNISNPIDFMDFLDFPTKATVTARSKQKTLLWKMLKGQIIDELLNTNIQLPTRDMVVESIIAGYRTNPLITTALRTSGLEAALRTVIATSLQFIPNRKPRFNDFNPFSTEAIRIQFADSVWDALAQNNYLMLLQAQFLYEGSLFEGETFLNTMNSLLSTKLGLRRTVLFRDLPIPFAVIAFNYATGKIVVYSSQTEPQMSVAEAVRRSMSLPLIFEPRLVNTRNLGLASTKTMIDGGVGSNFPIWLYSAAGDVYWPSASISESRIKIGLSVDETKAPPRSWNLNPAKFTLNENGAVELKDVLWPILVYKLRELGLFVSSPRNTEDNLRVEFESMKFLEVLTGYISADKEEAARQELIKGIMNGKNYFDISIPLLGFHGFDFSINGDRDDLDAIAERGFAAALSALKVTPLTGNAAPIIANAALFTNPYH